ncbi:hypothetical protein ARMSODRAFT_963173 [Armillaria solidipes]|uniref:DUF6699 domain-containing protein n=1 Tax=Armillaria solidipes TaxID=1076256 RepID=A0A2H3B0L6_9AGAR|nr:hypothetical protein ARMSODRAFT_963173 [Armillaria solidipes]
MKSESKSVRFANSPNELYAYDSDQAPSPVTARPTQRFAYTPAQLQLSSQARPHPIYTVYNSRSLSNTPSPVNSYTALPYPFALQTAAAPSSSSSMFASSSTPVVSMNPPPTPDQLRRTIPLPDVDEGSAVQGDKPWTIKAHELLRPTHPTHINIDLSTSLHAYIPTLSDEPATQPRLPTLTLVSKYLPWRLHVPPQGNYVTVRDLMASLYTALRVPVTHEEMKQAKGGRSVQQAFARRIQGKGHEEARKGVRRVDFLLKNSVFVGITETEDPKVWKICLVPRTSRQ